MSNRIVGTGEIDEMKEADRSIEEMEERAEEALEITKNPPTVSGSRTNSTYLSWDVIEFVVPTLVKDLFASLGKIETMREALEEIDEVDTHDAGRLKYIARQGLEAVDDD